MMRRTRYTDIVAGLPAFQPFVGPEAQERNTGRQFRARLGANESLFGPSPRAVAAMEAAARENWMYSDPENHALRHEIAAHHGVEIGNVVVGEGIDGLLGLTVQMFAGPGDVVVTSDGAYPTFNFHVAAHGAGLIKIPFRGFKEDLQNLANAAKVNHAKIVYVSNPNNPMGTWWGSSDLENFHARLPDDTVFILDEAYIDTAPQDAGLKIDCSATNIIRYRTFSKAYGLAGARIGYAIACEEIIRTFDKVRNHYGINRVGQIGALAALQDQIYLRDVVEKISSARQTLYDIAKQNGLSAVQSATNFVAIDCGGADEAERALDGLLRAGIFVRRPAVAPLNRHVRVSCGPPEDLAVFGEALGGVVKSL